MNKQVKINIKNKDYYCDMEILKLIERLQNKVEELECNRDEAIKFIENKWKKEHYYESIENCMEFCIFDKADLLNILRGEE